MTYARYRRIEWTVLLALAIPFFLLTWFGNRDGIGYKILSTAFFALLFVSLVTDRIARRRRPGGDD